MKLTVDLNEDQDPNAVGEMLMSMISPKGERWGYTTHTFKQNGWERVPVFIGGKPNDVIPLTLCCGCFAFEEYDRVTKYINRKLHLLVFLYWDGDGTIVIKNIQEGWMLYNSDMKKSYEWEWVDGYCWVNDLPEGYYE